jgi:hypothetical protein
MPGTDKILKGSEITTKKLEELKIAKSEAEKPIEDIAKEQLTVSVQMEKSLESIKNAGIFGTGLDTGMKVTTALETKAVDAANTFAETLKTSINNTSFGQTFVDSYTASIGKISEWVKKEVENISFTIENARTSLAEKIEKYELPVEEPKPSPSPTPTPGGDIFMPASKNTVITGSFGSFLPDPKDGILALPENDIDKLFSSYNLFNKMPTERLSPLPMKDLSKAEPIEKYIENKITTENKITNEVNIGGKTELEITLKTPDNNSEKILSLLLNNPELKETVMATINERLSKEYSDKLINVLPG